MTQTAAPAPATAPAATPATAPAATPATTPAAAALLDRAAIAARVPHAGAMCLLDRVLAWDPQTLVAASDGHRRDPHPLARDGRLPATAAIEYAAQAMALHGALIAPLDAAPTQGLLVGLRGVRLTRRWLDDVAPPLTIRVARFAGDARQVIYDFTVDADQPIAHGRAVVVLDATGLPS
ncbi:MAG: hydroxymyristoyl-ACP dehydratase [Lautropia sp.]